MAATRTRLLVEQHYTPADLAGLLKCSSRTIARRLDAGAFPRAILDGGRWRIPASDVAAYLDTRRPHAGA